MALAHTVGNIVKGHGGLGEEAELGAFPGNQPAYGNPDEPYGCLCGLAISEAAMSMVWSWSVGQGSIFLLVILFRFLSLYFRVTVPPFQPPSLALHPVF